MDNEYYYCLWQLEDETDSVISAVLGDCQRWITASSGALHVELGMHLHEEQAMNLCSQFYSPATYDGEGTHGSLFTVYPRQDD